MGAVLLLVVLPIVAALGFMLKTVQGGGGLLAGAMFLFLSIVIGLGSLQMARGWDEHEADH